MRKVMKYEEFEDFLSKFIEEPKSVKDEFLNQIFGPFTYGDLFNVVEQDGTIKVDVNRSDALERWSYIIKIDQSSRKYSVISEDISRNSKSYDIDAYYKRKFVLEYTNNSWENQPGYVIDFEERVSSFNRENGASVGKISDSMWQRKRYFDENGIEMKYDDTIKYYPVRENQYEFSFGLPEFNFRTPVKVVNNTVYRFGFATAIRYQTISNIYNGEEKNIKYDSLQYEHGRLPLLKAANGFLKNEETCKRIEEDYSNLTVEELKAGVLDLVVEPMKTALLEKYGFVDTNSRGRR